MADALYSNAGQRTSAGTCSACRHRRQRVYAGDHVVLVSSAGPASALGDAGTLAEPGASPTSTWASRWTPNSPGTPATSSLRPRGVQVPVRRAGPERTTSALTSGSPAPAPRTPSAWRTRSSSRRDRQPRRGAAQAATRPARDERLPGDRRRADDHAGRPAGDGVTPQTNKGCPHCPADTLPPYTPSRDHRWPAWVKPQDLLSTA